MARKVLILTIIHIIDTRKVNGPESTLYEFHNKKSDQIVHTFSTVLVTKFSKIHFNFVYETYVLDFWSIENFAGTTFREESVVDYHT